MPKTRSERAVDMVIDVYRPVMKAVLSTSISEHFSEAAWEEIVDKAVPHLREYLLKGYEFLSVLNEGDVLDAKGNVNGAAVLGGLRHMADQATTPKAKAMLNHLADHMRVVFTELRLLKGGDPDGERRSP